jgi:hypothetical protein
MTMARDKDGMFSGALNASRERRGALSARMTRRSIE